MIGTGGCQLPSRAKSITIFPIVVTLYPLLSFTFFILLTFHINKKL